MLEEIDETDIDNNVIALGSNGSLGAGRREDE